MAILNRTKDVSEQKDTYQMVMGTSIITGSTMYVGPLPSPGVISVVEVATFAGSVTSSLEITRFIPGAGLTTITGIGASFTMPVFGTSGVLAVSLVASGSTLLNVLANDIVQIRLNGGANNPMLAVAIKKTQDIVTTYGSAT